MSVRFTKTLSVPFFSCLLFLFALPLTAQHKAEAAPDHPKDDYSSPPQTTTKFLGQWDVQFMYDASTEAAQLGLSNGIHVGDEFWVAEWSSDTLIRYDNSGTVLEVFTISGLSGTRAFTWDGSSLWIANNSTTLYEVDPVSQSILGTINVDAGENIRFITWDPTADGGNGGFWGGNFNTDLFLFDLNGTTINSIPAATHTLGGMYGAAFDNLSAGGPYLWVFHQAGIPSDAIISQLQLPVGTPTGVGRDVTLDFGTPGDLAGGLFITDSWDPGGALTLGGVLQGEPDILFGYELDFQPGPDINLGAGEVVGPLSLCDLSATENIEVLINNDGQETVSQYDLDLYVNGTYITTETVTDPIAAGGQATYTFATPVDLSEPGVYEIEVIVIADGDINNANDPALSYLASRTVGYPPVDENFNLYADGQIAFTEVYNIGEVPFQANFGETPSTNTGPDGDIDGNGSYIYMETSDRASGDQAVLATNCLDLTTVDNMQLAFAYHAYGDGIGFLSVDVLDATGTVSNIFFQEGQFQNSNGADWEVIFLDMGDYLGETIEIIFTGEVGTEGDFFNCDIALDNIVLVGCPEATADVMITDATPADPGAIDLTITGGATAPYEFSWSNGADTEDLTDIGGGTYNVTVTDAKNCTTVLSYTVGGPSAVNEINGLAEWQVSPNPTSDLLTVDLMADQRLDGQLILYNQLGQVVRNLYDGQLWDGAAGFHIGDLPSGVYTLRLLVDGRQATQRVVKQ